MVEFDRKFLPWAAGRVAEEIEGGFPSLRGIPGSALEAAYEVLSRRSQTAAREYLLGELRRGVDWNLGADLSRRTGTAAEIEAELAETAARLRTRQRRGFDRRGFTSLLSSVFRETGHSDILSEDAVVVGLWQYGSAVARTEVVIGRHIVYRHVIFRGTEMACVQMSLACWLGIDGATTYEPGAEHSPELICDHLRSQWLSFLSALPALLEETPSSR